MVDEAGSDVDVGIAGVARSVSGPRARRVRRHTPDALQAEGPGDQAHSADGPGGHGAASDSDTFETGFPYTDSTVVSWRIRQAAGWPAAFEPIAAARVCAAGCHSRPAGAASPRCLESGR